ncbi:hypothetical protein [Mycolicibacterium mageritense]|uniref:Anti-sigma-M factor RsmA n=1 Tax=Mycolicibacterium mageritense TaxID=53462 RepID=A0AAI8TTP8_MYCME|nr:hypothetical protein [Mycolicibacterium mageritense]BDY28221.1 Anti-sigma-M factor RsmA [Mycolicibacterium mageritense]
MNGSPHPAADEPITPDLLADLQAGLLDDDTAARLRHRVRTDPEAAATLAALDRVRRELSALGTDNDSAPPLPPESARRVAVTLRHLDRTPQHRLRKTGLVASVCAAVLAIGVGTAMLLRTPDPVRSSSASIKDLTQPAPAADLQLTDQRILALLSGRPDFGMLSDPKRRADCLAGLGYPAGVKVLGAQPQQFAGKPGILILLPDDTPNSIVALVVAPDCTAAHTGLLSHTVVKRP